MLNLSQSIAREINLLDRARLHHKNLIRRLQLCYSERLYERTFEILDLERRLRDIITKKNSAYEAAFKAAHGI